MGDRKMDFIACDAVEEELILVSFKNTVILKQIPSCEQAEMKRGKKTEFSLYFFRLAVNYFPCHPRWVSWKELRLEKLTKKTFSCWKMLFHWNTDFVWGHAIFSVLACKEIENQVSIRLCLVCLDISLLFTMYFVLYYKIRKNIGKTSKFDQSRTFRKAWRRLI